MHESLGYLTPFDFYIPYLAKQFNISPDNEKMHHMLGTHTFFELSLDFLKVFIYDNLRNKKVRKKENFIFLSFKLGIQIINLIVLEMIGIVKK
ncbi:hypothetical protein CSA08_04735 [Candidatus Gracilibacteria bacterium]|nr:MAG: hypothetical protein CSA08_04735 [Candidatus Gracilibacteria bacterium]